MLTRRQMLSNLAYKDNTERKKVKLKKVKDLKKNQAQIMNSMVAKKRKDIIGKIAFLAFSFGISFFVVYRSDNLFTMQKTINGINSSISVLDEQNNSLYKDVLMKQDIKRIESIAINELDMTDINRSDVKVINDPVDYFDAQPVKKEGILEIIKNFFNNF
ncbi:MAG: hypothetical protein FWC47_13160 [Oscillospiraceae bacterium]|nr:hypothetical protein [Oscillospiraceae bacterium]